MLPKKTEEPEAAEVGRIEAIIADLNIDLHFAVGDARDAMLNILRQSADWSKFPEAKQRDINTAIGNAAREIVANLVEQIAAEGRETLSVSIESIAIKDGLKITLKAPLDVDHFGELADAKTALLCLVKPEKFDNARSAPKVDADQPELLSSETDDLAEAGDAVLETGDVFEHGEHGECEVEIDLVKNAVMLTPTSGSALEKIELRDATSEEIRRESERQADEAPAKEPVEA
jgi:hypothetical protein